MCTYVHPRRAWVHLSIPLIEYSITAEFSEGDPAYDWIINFIVRSGGGGITVINTDSGF